MDGPDLAFAADLPLIGLGRALDASSAGQLKAHGWNRWRRAAANSFSPTTSPAG